MGSHAQNCGHRLVFGTQGKGFSRIARPTLFSKIDERSKFDTQKGPIFGVI
jgi:hypothetical protein